MMLGINEERKYGACPLCLPDLAFVVPRWPNKRQFSRRKDASEPLTDNIVGRYLSSRVQYASFEIHLTWKVLDSKHSENMRSKLLVSGYHEAAGSMRRKRADFH
jgi:hypothetical protein